MNNFLKNLLFVFIIIISLSYSDPSKASFERTYAEAMAGCQEDVARNSKAYPDASYKCINGGVVAPGSSNCKVTEIQTFNGNTTDLLYVQYPCSTEPSQCKSGQNVPAGTTVDVFSPSNPVGPDDREYCLAGCEIAMVVGIGAAASMSGTYELNGAVCAGTGTEKNTASVTKASETVNADGSKTYCDPISGKCVTSKPPDAPPAPATSTGNNSTTANSNTDTKPASSSSSGGTGTGGTGTGGTGTGTGTGSGSTGTGSGDGDKPASSSSTSTKCTTGVCDVGEADGSIGDLYTPSGDTPSSVFSSFKAGVSGSPIMSAATSFFQVNVSGSCPTWHNRQ